MKSRSHGFDQLALPVRPGPIGQQNDRQARIQVDPK
jgi:hypothetical protein